MGSAPPWLSGIFWMSLTTLLFVGQDSTARVLMHSYPLIEVTWARYFVHVLIATGIVLLRRPSAMRANAPSLQILRSTLLLGVTLLANISIQHLRFVDYTAIMWVTPVLVTALSVFILKEQVGLVGWLSVCAGMTGVLIISNPTGLDFSPWMVLPVIGAFCNANYQITTRLLFGRDTPLTTFFYTGLVGVVVMSVLLPFTGIWPNVRDAALMGLLGAMGGGSHYCLIRAYTAAPASTIAPFGYTSLLWATLISSTVFGEIPSPRSLLGAAFIIVGGVSMVLYQNRRAAAKMVEKTSTP
ncbi:DMT family transporter [Beijerinckia mobilis]|uniref:DMT family transporter n=1 Tax=Beijerinckia mobilis TaxID=231434 RepID=UPI00068FC6AB|nr:DMT family transporter [Beijerinckia mobilis]